MSHTKEPWSVAGIYGDCASAKDGGFVFMDCIGRPLEERQANARRIVACVNACAGMSHEQLELISEFGGVQKSFDLIEKQRDELLAALKKTREDINWMLNSKQFLNGFVFDYIDEAIASVKGEKE